MKWVNIGSGNGLSPFRRQAITWTKVRLIVNWTFRNKLQWNSNQNTKLFIHENVFENVVCEMASISSVGRWVKWWHYCILSVISVMSVWRDNDVTFTLCICWQTKRFQRFHELHTWVVKMTPTQKVINSHQHGACYPDGHHCDYFSGTLSSCSGHCNSRENRV